MSATKRNLVTARIVSIVGHNGHEVRYDAQRAPILHQTMSERRLAQALRSERAVWVPMATHRSDNPQPPAVLSIVPPLVHEIPARICAGVVAGSAVVLFLGVLSLAGWL